MSYRKQALGRLWALAWQAVIGYVLAIVIGVIAAVWATVDILWQLIAGSDGLSSNATPAQWVSRTLEWSVSQTLYGLLGTGDGKWVAFP